MAIVISLVLVFVGLLSMRSLPKSQFPDIVPPMVVVYASFPGASATVLTNSVLIPLEQAINGTPGMKYMFSTAASSGEANIQIVFNMGEDPNQALVNVQNRIEGWDPIGPFEPAECWFSILWRALGRSCQRLMP